MAYGSIPSQRVFAWVEREDGPSGSGLGVGLRIGAWSRTWVERKMVPMMTRMTPIACDDALSTSSSTRLPVSTSLKSFDPRFFSASCTR
eukprot:7190520-Prymnesium_polylepis.1